MQIREDRIAVLTTLCQNRILVMDGAMGTMIQRYKLSETDFRGTRFKDRNNDLKGNNDLLSLTAPNVIKTIHNDFLDAGADILESNTFNSTRISMADYAMEDLAYELNVTGAKLARECADAFTDKTPDKPRFVAGSIGPMNKTLSVSPDVDNPGFREVSFDGVVAAYKEQVRGLIEGGVDLILIETIFDTLNAKAAIFATQDVFEDLGITLPIMLSCTVTDMSGRNLSGQTVEAFWYSVRHAKPFSVGLNCAFGAEHLRPHAKVLSEIADTRICVYPNAGLPNEMGEYDETPAMTSAHLADWAASGLLNITGGCCGTTPDHIRAIVDAVKGVPPRVIPKANHQMRLSGIDPITIIHSQISDAAEVAV